MNLWFTFYLDQERYKWFKISEFKIQIHMKLTNINFAYFLKFLLKQNKTKQKINIMNKESKDSVHKVKNFGYYKSFCFCLVGIVVLIRTYWCLLINTRTLRKIFPPHLITRFSKNLKRRFLLEITVIQK